MKLLPGACLCILLLGTCRREEIVILNYAARNTWVVEEDVFTKHRSSYYLSGPDSLFTISFSDADTGETNLLHLRFIEAPVSGRDYRIVGRPDTSNEVSIGVYHKHDDDYSGSNDELGGILQARNVDGKLTFIATDIEMEVSGFWRNDFVTLSLHLVE